MAALNNPNFDFFPIFLGNENGYSEHCNGFASVVFVLHIFLMQLI